MMIAIKYGFTSVMAGFTTVVLLFLMQSLIDAGQPAMTEDIVGSLVEFTRIRQDEDLQLKRRKPEPPPPADQPPPTTPEPEFDVPLDPAAWSISGMLVDENLGMFGSTDFSADGNYLPIMKVQPLYPRIALSRGLFGWVVVEFTVTKQGMVIDPYVLSRCVMDEHIASTDSCLENNRVFDKSALQAALKFKYIPKVMDGNPVASLGVRNRIVFKLENE